MYYVLASFAVKTCKSIFIETAIVRNSFFKK